MGAKIAPPVPLTACVSDAKGPTASSAGVSWEKTRDMSHCVEQSGSSCPDRSIAWRVGRLRRAFRAARGKADVDTVPVSLGIQVARTRPSLRETTR